MVAPQRNAAPPRNLIATPGANVIRVSGFDSPAPPPHTEQRLKTASSYIGVAIDHLHRGGSLDSIPHNPPPTKGIYRIIDELIAPVVRVLQDRSIAETLRDTVELTTLLQALLKESPNTFLDNPPHLARGALGKKEHPLLGQTTPAMNGWMESVSSAVATEVRAKLNNTSLSPELALTAIAGATLTVHLSVLRALDLDPFRSDTHPYLVSRLGELLSQGVATSVVSKLLEGRSLSFARYQSQLWNRATSLKHQEARIVQRAAELVEGAASQSAHEAILDRVTSVLRGQDLTPRSLPELLPGALTIILSTSDVTGQLLWSAFDGRNGTKSIGLVSQTQGALEPIEVGLFVDVMGKPLDMLQMGSDGTLFRSPHELFVPEQYRKVPRSGAATILRLMTLHHSQLKAMAPALKNFVAHPDRCGDVIVDLSGENPRALIPEIDRELAQRILPKATENPADNAIKQSFGLFPAEESWSCFATPPRDNYANIRRSTAATGEYLDRYREDFGGIVPRSPSH